MEQSKIDEIINSDLTKIIESLNSNFIDFSLDKISILIPKLIIIAEKYKTLRGFEKKELVIELLKNIVNKYDNVDNSMLEPIINNLVPSIIDSLISVDKKHIKLKKKNMLKWLKWFKCFKK